VIEAILRCNPIKVFLLLAAPFLAVALVAAMAALLSSSEHGNMVWLLIALALLHTGIIVLALGFVAVALLPRPNWSDARRIRSTGSTDTDEGNGHGPAARLTQDA